MAVREAQKKYNERNIKRIPLDVQKSFYDELYVLVSSQGLTINGYIKEAIRERMERDKQAQTETKTETT